MEELAEVDTEVELVSFTAEDLGLQARCEEGRKEYVAGFIARKFKEDYLNLSCSNPIGGNGVWVPMLSSGGLTQPSQVWFSYFRKFEELFEIFHKNGGVDKNFGVVKRFADYLNENYPEVPQEITSYYSKVRTIIRITNINKRIEDRKFIMQERSRNYQKPATETESLRDPDSEWDEDFLDQSDENQTIQELLDSLEIENTC